MVMRFPLKTVGIVVVSLLVGFFFSDKISESLNLSKAEINVVSVVYEPTASRKFVTFLDNFLYLKAKTHGIKIRKVEVLESENICDEIAIQESDDIVLQISISGERCALDAANIIQVFPLKAFAGFKVLLDEMPMLFEAAHENEAVNALTHILTTLPGLKVSKFPRLTSFATNFPIDVYLVPCIVLLLAAVVFYEFYLRPNRMPEIEAVHSIQEFRRRLRTQHGEECKHEGKEKAKPPMDAPPSYGALVRAPKKFDAQMPVSSENFAKYMNEAVEFAVDYLENNDRYPVTTDKKPGFLLKSLPAQAPVNPEDFGIIMSDMHTKILPGLTHWQHKRFHAFFPAGSSYPDVIADVLVSALGVVGFTYDACPALAEMEMAMVNWLGRALGLSEQFMCQDDGNNSFGGGSIQPSASDCIYMAIIASRFNKIRSEATEMNINEHSTKEERVAAETEILSKLVAYSSPEAHSSFMKGCNMAMVRCHLVESDENFSLRGDALERQILEDEAKGLIPFHVHCTMGTTALCAFDNIDEIGKIAEKYNCWFHVDAAYAGSAMICPEFRHFAKGIERADSINVNPHKFMLQSAVQSFIWTNKKDAMKAAFKVKASYYQNQHSQSSDPRDYGVSLSRRFQGLRLWFLFRMYGLSGIQTYIRRLVGHAATFERLLRSDPRLEIVGKRELGLVVFKIRHPCEEVSSELTKGLVDHVNRSRKMLVTHSEVKGVHLCRINMSHERTTESDVLESWEILKGLITEFLAQQNSSGVVRSRRSALRLCTYDYPLCSDDK